MRILVHSPYWETAGGGERYALTVAACLEARAEVWVSVSSKEKLEGLVKRMGIELGGVRQLTGRVTKKRLLGFDGVFWVSDGSIPLLPVKKRVVHFQAPFHSVGGRSVRTKLKLAGTKIVCNSRYTKSFIDREFGVRSLVVYPPVEVEKIRPRKKQQLILTVGRFATSSQHKRQEALVRAFRMMVDQGLAGWRLAVVGGVVDEATSRAEVARLRRMSRGYPIAIRTNLAHYRLVELYGQAAIYWHAAGYGVDLVTHPERAEHFGISTVEAMAAAAVPVVFKAGGQKEIVEEGTSGLFWTEPTELVTTSMELIDDPLRRQRLGEAAAKRAQAFRRARFCREIREVFGL